MQYPLSLCNKLFLQYSSYVGELADTDPNRVIELGQTVTIPDEPTGIANEVVTCIITTSSF